MQQVRCGLCGRGFLGDLAANSTCPSCGYAGAIAETGMPSAAAVPADVSIVRHFDPATMGRPAPEPVSQPDPAPSEPAPLDVAPLAPVTPRADESPSQPSQPYMAYQAPPTPALDAQPDPGMTQAETPPAAAQPAMTPPAPLAQPPQPMPAPPASTPVSEAPVMPAGYAPYQAPPTQPPTQPPYPYAPVQAPGTPYGYPAQPVQPQPPAGYSQQPPAGYPPSAPTLPYGYPPQGMQAPPTLPPAPGAQPAYGGPYGAPGGFQPPYPGMMVPPQPPEKRRNNTLIAVIAGVVLLAIVLGVIGVLALKGGLHAKVTPTPTATAQPTATATSTVPTGFTAYTDANKLYSIGYPSDWSKTETSASGVSEALFANSDHSDIYEVAETPAAGYSTSDLASVLGGFFTGFAGSLPGGKGGVSNQTRPQDVSIAGQTWTQEAADVNYTDSSGASATAHAEVAAVVQNNHIFIIANVTQDATVFDTEKSLYFTPITDTFTFLG